MQHGKPREEPCLGAAAAGGMDDEVEVDAERGGLSGNSAAQTT